MSYRERSYRSNTREVDLISYSPPRRSSTASRSSRRNEDDDRSPGHRSNRRKRTRSRSPEEVKHDVKRFGPNAFYSPEDIRAIENLHCRICDVRLHDEGSMKAHIDGRPHLAMKNKIAANQIRNDSGLSLLDTVKPDPAFYDSDSKFWIKEEQKSRMLGTKDMKKEAERLDEMKPKFNKTKYDHAQFSGSDRKDLYCEICGVTVVTRDVMESHRAGKEHIRKASKIERFSCRICLINVPCQDTLNNHMRGKDHIKRVQDLEQEKQYRRRPEEEGEDTGDTRIQLKQLEDANNTLKRTVKELMHETQECRRNHAPLEQARKKAIQAQRELDESREEEKRLLKEIEKLERIAAMAPPVKVKKKEEYMEERNNPDLITLD